MFQLPVLAVDDPWHISHERGAELPHDGERFNLAVVQQAPAQIRALHEDVTKGQVVHHLGGAHVGHRDQFHDFGEARTRGDTDRVVFLANVSSYRPAYVHLAGDCTIAGT
jgi:hypothetical protein